MAEPQPDLTRVAELQAQLASDGFVDLETTVALPLSLGCIALAVTILLAVSPPKQGPRRRGRSSASPWRVWPCWP